MLCFLSLVVVSTPSSLLYEAISASFNPSVERILPMPATFEPSLLELKLLLSL
jgi:hypothetical protein